MRRRAGWALTAAIAVWDADAMRAHIAAHSWLTLGWVVLILTGHMADLLTINRLTSPCEWLSKAAE